jgi:hypothetical protein
VTPEQFCYWLNGFCELSTEPPTAEQWKAIKEHLQTVFHKVTPPAPGSPAPMTGEQLRRMIEGMPTPDKAGWPGSPYTLGPTVIC